MNMKKQLALGGALLTAATAACLKLAQWHRQRGLFLRSFVFSGNTGRADNLVGVGNRQGKVPCAIEPRHEKIIGRKTQ